MKIQGEKCLEAYKEENRKVKRCIYQSKEEVQEQFVRKMNQDLNGNRKLFFLLRSNLSRQHSKVLYHWEVRRRGKAGKTRKSRSKEKVVGFSSASLFPARKQQGGIMESGG